MQVRFLIKFVLKYTLFFFTGVSVLIFWYYVLKWTPFVHPQPPGDLKFRNLENSNIQGVNSKRQIPCFTQFHEVNSNALNYKPSSLRWKISWSIEYWGSPIACHDFKVLLRIWFMFCFVFGGTKRNQVYLHTVFLPQKFVQTTRCVAYPDYFTLWINFALSSGNDFLSKQLTSADLLQ